MKRTAFSTALMLGLAACGGGESADAGAEMDTASEAPAAEAAAPSTEVTMPSWYQQNGENVTLDIVAGATSAGNYWNFNGAVQGEMTIYVPVGSTVNVNFSNQDPNMAHSIGISANFDTAPAMIDAVPVFEGAISENPADMAGATLPGESETFSFVASEAGEYKMVCYIAGHIVSGMWINFVVTDDGQAGVMGAM